MDVARGPNKLMITDFSMTPGTGTGSVSSFSVWFQRGFFRSWVCNLGISETLKMIGKHGKMGQKMLSTVSTFFFHSKHWGKMHRLKKPPVTGLRGPPKKSIYEVFSPLVMFDDVKNPWRVAKTRGFFSSFWCFRIFQLISLRCVGLSPWFLSGISGYNPGN